MGPTPPYYIYLGWGVAHPRGVPTQRLGRGREMMTGPERFTPRRGRTICGVGTKHKGYPTVG